MNNPHTSDATQPSQSKTRPDMFFIGGITLFLFFNVCICSLYLFRPIGTFYVDGAVSDITINEGTSVALEWETAPWRFASIRIDPTVGPVSEPAGVVMVAPKHTERYEIQIETWTSQLLPFIYPNYLGNKNITIYVTPAPTPSVTRIYDFRIVPTKTISATAIEIELRWVVQGDSIEAIEISSPHYNTIPNLSNEGRITLFIDKTTVFVLSVYDGEDVMSRMLAITSDGKVSIPEGQFKATATPRCCSHNH